ncbi:MAG: thiamine phosphate synthase, partial [bacterium]
MKIIDWKLCLVADSEASERKNILSVIKEATGEGVTLVQLRGKKLKTREFLDLALKASGFLRAKNIPLIINDRVDIALSCNAAGVHLGQQDLPLLYARKILGEKKLIGITINTVKEAMVAEEGGADYLGAGPVFLTTTKEELNPVLGLEGLRALKEKVKIPILAIGGINPDNAGDVIATGVEGIAVVSAILGAENVRKATRELIEAIKTKLYENLLLV